MTNKIITILISMCIGGLLYGCSEYDVKAQNINTNFEVISDTENIYGNDIYIIEDKQYSKQYIVIDPRDARKGLSMVERNMK